MIESLIPFYVQRVNTGSPDAQNGQKRITNLFGLPPVGDGNLRKLFIADTSVYLRRTKKGTLGINFDDEKVKVAVESVSTITGETIEETAIACSGVLNLNALRRHQEQSEAPYTNHLVIGQAGGQGDSVIRVDLY